MYCTSRVQLQHYPQPQYEPSSYRSRGWQWSKWPWGSITLSDTLIVIVLGQQWPFPPNSHTDTGLTPNVHYCAMLACVKQSLPQCVILPVLNTHMVTIEFQEQGLAVAKMALGLKYLIWLWLPLVSSAPPPSPGCAQSVWEYGKYSKIHNKSQQ